MEDTNDIKNSITKLMNAIECDYGKIKLPGQLYEKEMRDYPLSEAVIDKLVELYHNFYMNKVQ